MVLSDNDSLLMYALLILGGGVMCFAMAGTYIGKTRDRLGRAVYRAKDPVYFWRLIVVYYLIGICSVGRFLYEIFRTPR